MPACFIKKMNEYEGIDIQGLNQIATLDAYSEDELDIVCNMFSRRLCGRDIVKYTYKKKKY